MSNWSASVYSEPSSSSSSSGFLAQLDASLYDGIPMQDPVLEGEAKEWAKRFLHLRVTGVACKLHEPPFLPPVSSLRTTSSLQLSQTQRSESRLPSLPRSNTKK